MTLTEFEHNVFAVAASSSICGVPIVRRIIPTSINLLITGDFVEVFFNEQTGRVAYALIRGNERIFGADNTGGWHLHPFDEPRRHEPLPEAMSFADFISEVESHLAQP